MSVCWLQASWQGRKGRLKEQQGRGRRGRFCLGRTLEAGTERESRQLGKSLKAGGKAWQGGRGPCLYCSLLVNLQYNLIPAHDPRVVATVASFPLPKILLPPAYLPTYLSTSLEREYHYDSISG